jgi:hypothetical protein
MLTKWWCGLAVVAVSCSAAGAEGSPQLRVSPGPLTRAHAALEGVTRCARCHDATPALSASRCLACHARVADRIARKRGVHRDVRDDCARCHPEHRGVETDLRRLDRGTFNHLLETGFPLEGQHARLATACARCHTTRSFLTARAACDSCHEDPHHGALGRECAACHSASVTFKRTRDRFDHARARFALTGAHQVVACEKCHAAGVFRGLRFDACSSCHQTPHRRTLGPTCAGCHTTDRWTTAGRGFDHAKSGFVLAGAHRPLACARCHVAGVKTPLRFDRCSSCHENVHRDSIRDDCRACHTEETFRKASFDHRVRTGFPLAGKHTSLACRQCHAGLPSSDGAPGRTVVDFGGASAACVACHKDPHKAEFGRACDACHQPATFKAAGFTHPRNPEFFAGRHREVACVRCHVRPGTPLPDPRAPRAAPARRPSFACSECHADAHLGQVGPACERCHAVDAPRFTPTRFSHDAAAFVLSGRHRAAPCAKCHPSETAAFPAGRGTAVRLHPVPTDCGACHKDPHMGEASPRCATCHSTDAFTLTSYAHAGLDHVFSVGNHDRLSCTACHRRETGQFPAGYGTAIRLKVARTCVGCHP